MVEQPAKLPEMETRRWGYCCTASKRWSARELLLMPGKQADSKTARSHVEQILIHRGFLSPERQGLIGFPSLGELNSLAVSCGC